MHRDIMSASSDDDAGVTADSWTWCTSAADVREGGMPDNPRPPWIPPVSGRKVFNQAARSLAALAAQPKWHMVVTRARSLAVCTASGSVRPREDTETGRAVGRVTVGVAATGVLVPGTGVPAAPLCTVVADTAGNGTMGVLAAVGTTPADAVAVALGPGSGSPGDPVANVAAGEALPGDPLGNDSAAEEGARTAAAAAACTVEAEATGETCVCSPPSADAVCSCSDGSARAAALSETTDADGAAAAGGATETAVVEVDDRGGGATVGFIERSVEPRRSKGATSPNSAVPS